MRTNRKDKSGGRYQLMHNKILIIDGKVVLSGSCNLTEQSKLSHYENVRMSLNVSYLQQQQNKLFL